MLDIYNRVIIEFMMKYIAHGLDISYSPCTFLYREMELYNEFREDFYKMKRFERNLNELAVK